MGTIALVACCDTKYHELGFVRKAVAEAGHTPIILDISTGPSAPIPGDITREEILLEGGHSLEEIKGLNKSDAIAAMSESISKVLYRLCKEKKIDGVLGMGGLQNTVVCSAALRLLPIGFPKMIASTVASGGRCFDTVVGDKDITVVPSIVDFAGMNPISEVVLSNAVAAVIGMVEHGKGEMDTTGRFLIGTTLMGVTNDTVMAAADKLTALGKEVISFHSTGSGGRIMEQMIRDGHIKAVMDLTLHEMTAEYFLDYGYSKGALNRLTAVAETGVPVLVCPGGIDFACLRKDELFEDEEKRGYVWHNPELTHTKLYESEILDITHTIIERVNKSIGKVTVVLPMGGLRTLSRAGEPFHKPETIKKMKALFEKELSPKIRFRCVDFNYMDPEFADLLVEEMRALLEER
ncbi:MAG: UPF0261 family protein [Ruminococcaceae bacterium]|nr:UPF0261 family protein [Oscillospiraceae bacterium]